jgi:hypothetical protein
MRSAEEPILYGLFITVGIIPVVLACARGLPFGAEETIGALLVAAGLLGLVRR